ncbi:MAG: 4-hydroxy-tetrahydrodipicolinate synthase [Ruminococcaceae bacterium]|nr:4-hydroxy-tetrahydrodipicolinate synthase [Oscillospiraceae bacterium]
MKKTIFTGAATALITPFKNGKIDYEAFANIIENQIANSIDALVVCGTTGEGSTLSDAEHREITSFCIEKVNHRVPVIAGTGSNDTSYAIELSKFAQEEGADGLLLVTPYYNKTSQTGLVHHFNAIADSVNVPCLVYNVPSRTGVNILPDTYLELSKHQNIVGFKEANGNISAMAKTMSLVGDELAMYSGDDDQIVPILSLGGKGVISVLSNVAPKVTHDICSLFFEGKTKESLDLHLKHIKLMNALFCDVNPIPVKAAMAKLGFCDEEMRLPLYPLGKANRDLLYEAMEVLK